MSNNPTKQAIYNGQQVYANYNPAKQKERRKESIHLNMKPSHPLEILPSLSGIRGKSWCDNIIKE